MYRFKTDKLGITGLISCLLAILLSACTVGPEYRRPAPPEVDTYTEPALQEHAMLAASEPAATQHFISGADIHTQWWRELAAPGLDALIEQALQANPELAALQARLRQAQGAQAALAGSTRFPQIDARLDSQRQRLNSAATGQPGEGQVFSLFNARGELTYPLDIAGGNRRALEALAARSDYQDYQLKDARLKLATAVARTAIEQARLSAQLRAMQSILDARQAQLDLTRLQQQLGHASEDEVRTMQVRLEQTRAELAPLHQQLAQSRHLLAILSGQPPGVGVSSWFKLEDFRLPTALPLVVPSELVRRRADIRAAEALLQAANAEYGVAISRLYPQLNLSAQLGSQALTPGTLFGGGSTTWNLVGQLTQPLFKPGLSAEKRAALAAFESAAANYQSVVLESLRDVADTLKALDNDARIVAAQATADATAQASLQSAQDSYALGAVSFLQLLAQQTLAEETRIKLIDARARQLIDTTSLYQAMGVFGEHS